MVLGESPAVVTAACVIGLLAGIAGRMVLLWNLHSVVYNLVGPYNMVRLAFPRRDSNDSHFRSRMMAVIEYGWSYLYGVLVTNLAALLCTDSTFLVR